MSDSNSSNSNQPPPPPILCRSVTVRPGMGPGRQAALARQEEIQNQYAQGRLSAAEARKLCNDAANAKHDNVKGFIYLLKKFGIYHYQPDQLDEHYDELRKHSDDENPPGGAACLVAYDDQERVENFSSQQISCGG